jgi:methylmalonyl-CoA/ethylmalonyl-CoA epimerase
LDTEFVDISVNEEEGARSAASSTGLELIAPPRSDSEVARFIDKRGEGLYALAFSVFDIGKARAKAEKMGIRVVGDVNVDSGPAKGLREIWLHPKDSLGVFLMFIQDNT